MARLDWYDRPDLYDALFNWDLGTEVDFLVAASERWGLGPPRRFLEPFCGTGRLLGGVPGFGIGFDRNRNMLRHAAQRGLRVFRADAGGFALAPESFDFAFCLIDSFRYLLSEEAARAHLRGVARALRPGGAYVLGFDLVGDVSVERWEHGGLTCEVGLLGDSDPDSRIETIRSVVDTGAGVLETLAPMRTYTARQVEDLIDDEASFEIAAVFDRGYDLGHPVEISEVEGSIVLVLVRGV
ncbi:MAG: methyltransferase domain-containing protein [Planctomycetota bacterium]